MKLATICLLLGLMCTTPAHGQGISLSWNECVADGGTRNATFACNTNAGFRALVASFVLPAGLTKLSALNGTIDLVAADLTVPAWLNFTVCRSGSLSYNAAAAAPLSCQALTGFCSNGISVQAPVANGERIEFARTHAPNCSPTAPDVAAGTQYVAAVLEMNFNRTVGSPSCGGCDVGACLLLTRVQVTGTTGSVELTQPDILPDGNVVTWQGVGLTPAGTCQGATPTRRAVWGDVKALYR